MNFRILLIALLAASCGACSKPASEPVAPAEETAAAPEATEEAAAGEEAQQRLLLVLGQMGGQGCVACVRRDRGAVHIDPASAAGSGEPAFGFPVRRPRFDRAFKI